MSHLKKKSQKFESIRDLYQNCRSYYNVDKIQKCLKWIHGVDKIFHYNSSFLQEEDNYSWDFYWKNEKLLSFKSKKSNLNDHEYIIQTLEQYHLLFKLEQLID